MDTRVRNPFMMALAMAFIATVLVPTTSEAKYRKRSLPTACSDATVAPFWDGKEVTLVPGGSTKELLFFVAMAALDPQTGGETPIAKAKWAMLCDKQREAYKVWLESVTRTGVYLVLDYRLSGPEVFGGTSYPDVDGDTEELEAMDIEVIGDLLMKSLSDLTVLDLVAAGRPGTPHNGGSLGNFSSAVCRFTGRGCPKKATPIAAVTTIREPPPVVAAEPPLAPPPPVAAEEEKCPDGSPKPCAPPTPGSQPPAEEPAASPAPSPSGQVP